MLKDDKYLQLLKKFLTRLRIIVILDLTLRTLFNLKHVLYLV